MSAYRPLGPVLVMIPRANNYSAFLENNPPLLLGGPADVDVPSVRKAPLGSCKFITRRSRFVPESPYYPTVGNNFSFNAEFVRSIRAVCARRNNTTCN